MKTITESPDKWVILKLPNNNYKVFGTWAGGYLTGDRWKLNSGITKVEHDENFYYFTGFSGSCYKCHKKGYGIATSYGLSILNKLIKQGCGKVEIMKHDNDWENLIH